MISALDLPRQTSAAAAAPFKFRRDLWVQPVQPISCQSGALALDVTGS